MAEMTISLNYSLSDRIYRASKIALTRTSPA